jgi:hypothetical protein
MGKLYIQYILNPLTGLYFIRMVTHNNNKQ